MPRQLPEWRGSSPDSVAPPHVRLRIFERYKGICHFSGITIRPGDQWDCDHVIALINGGENRESNLAPILRGKAHKAKTRHDVAEKSRNYRKRAKHLGIAPKRPKIKSRSFPKFEPQRSASRPLSRRTVERQP